MVGQARCGFWTTRCGRDVSDTKEQRCIDTKAVVWRTREAAKSETGRLVPQGSGLEKGMS